MLTRIRLAHCPESHLELVRACEGSACTRLLHNTQSCLPVFAHQPAPVPTLLVFYSPALLVHRVHSGNCCMCVDYTACAGLHPSRAHLQTIRNGDSSPPHCRLA